MSKKLERIHYLFYGVGKQRSNLLFQKQINEKNDYFYSKRVHLFDVEWDGSKFVDELNNRTCLQNEVIFDFDPSDFKFNKKKYKAHILKLKKFLDKKADSYDFWWSGSKGVHAHAFFSEFFFKPEWRRSEIRGAYIHKFNCDPQLKSEHVTITCEYSRNAKTGTFKTPFDIDFDFDWLFKKWDGIGVQA